MFESVRKRLDSSSAPVGEAETIIGRNTLIKGEVSGEENIRVDGTIEGNISIEGNAFIGENGVVSGDIKAQDLIIAGSVTGNCHIEGSLCIQSTGQLVGDVKVKSFNIEDGGIFMGRSEMSLRGLQIPPMESIRPSAYKNAAIPAEAIVTKEEEDYLASPPAPKARPGKK